MSLHLSAPRAPRRSRAMSSFTLLDEDTTRRIFLATDLDDRGAFARVCRMWSEVANRVWAVHHFCVPRERTEVNVESPFGSRVAQLFAWEDHSRSDRQFFVLALGECGLMVRYKIRQHAATDAERDIMSVRKFDVFLGPMGDRTDDDAPLLPGVPSSFCVTIHQKYAIVVRKGLPALVKSYGHLKQPQSLVHILPPAVSCVSMCTIAPRVCASGMPGSRSWSIHVQMMSDPATPFQTLETSHQAPIRWLLHSPDGLRLFSCSSDCLQLWWRRLPTGALGKKEEAYVQGAMRWEGTPEHTLFQPRGDEVRLAMVHPSWRSVLLATNEALEVRQLVDRSATGGASSTPQQQLGIVQRREMQVTAACFAVEGSRLVVSDRGDRLLVFVYDGLQPSVQVVLHPFTPSICRPVSSMVEFFHTVASGSAYLAVGSDRGHVKLVLVPLTECLSSSM